MEAFSNRLIDECVILNEKEVSRCGFLDSVLGPKIKQVLTAGAWLSPGPGAVVATLCLSSTLLWANPQPLEACKALFSSPVAFIVFKKSGGTLTCH